MPQAKADGFSMPSAALTLMSHLLSSSKGTAFSCATKYGRNTAVLYFGHRGWLILHLDLFTRFI